MPERHIGQKILDLKPFSEEYEKYQIRAMRAGRGRQFTREAMIKN